MVTGRLKNIIIGNTTIQLIIEIMIFPCIAVIGNIILGKYTKWIVGPLREREVTAPCSAFPKQPHTTTPKITHTGYILSALPASMMNRK